MVHKKKPAAYYCNRHLLSETRIACVDATEFLSDVYKPVHKKNRLQFLTTGTNSQGLG